MQFTTTEMLGFQFKGQMMTIYKYSVGQKVHLGFSL